ncbi:GNAT family N-acetyltransferase [Mycoplasmatota bacterium WC44]
MKVRDAIPSDFIKISELFEQVDELHREAHPNIFINPNQTARSNEFLNTVLQDDRKRLIVAIENNEVIGLAKADIRSSPDIPLYKNREWLSIGTIVVDKNYRGKGIGKILLEKLYEWAKIHKVDEVELTVFSFNESAIKFYNKNGFNDVSRRMCNRISK